MNLNKLKAMRKKRGMTYNDMALKLGISKEFYWMIENGKRTLSYSKAVQIAEIFKKEPDEIFLR